MRKLTRIARIDKIVPHKNADRLEVAIIGGWPAVVRKGEFVEGQPVLFCEVDTLLPAHKVFAFLGEPNHTEPDGTKWYRLQTMRLRGQLSQGIVLSTTTLLEFFPEKLIGEWPSLMHLIHSGSIGLWEGRCMDDFIGVRKYEPALPASLAGVARGHFPTFIPKTDEERIQNLDISELVGKEFYRSEKLDGTSCTVYNCGGYTGVCSRNLDLERDENNTLWKAAFEGGVIDAVNAKRSVAIQGEVCGPGIQGNRYGLTKHTFFAFNTFDIYSRCYQLKDHFHRECRSYGIKTVPVLDSNQCPETIEQVLEDAEGKSQLCRTTEREGVVWVSHEGNRRVSFKAISNKFLLKGGE